MNLKEPRRRILDERPKNNRLVIHEQQIRPRRFTQPRVEFKGYTLLNKLPQFHYSVDGVPVREWIAPLTNELGLCRTFRITDLPQGAWFIAPDAREGRVTSSLGDPVGGKIQIPAGQELIFDVKVLAR